VINLLPPEIKSGYRYARSNVTLRKWVIMCAIAIVGLGAIATYGLLAIHQSSNHYNSQIAATEAQFQKEHYTQTQQQVQDISNSFKLVVNVLGQEILFSKLIQQIAAAIPIKANLTALNISQTQSAMDITINAADYATATQAQVNLSDPANKIFSKADIVSINCDAKAANGQQYPCNVNIRALFASNNTFLFINSKGMKP
jgi:hypothetical protein